MSHHRHRQYTIYICITNFILNKCIWPSSLRIQCSGGRYTIYIEYSISDWLTVCITHDTRSIYVVCDVCITTRHLLPIEHHSEIASDIWTPKMRSMDNTIYKWIICSPDRIAGHAQTQSRIESVMLFVSHPARQEHEQRTANSPTSTHKWPIECN